jgi:hypothetical protein
VATDLIIGNSHRVVFFKLASCRRRQLTTFTVKPALMAAGALPQPGYWMQIANRQNWQYAVCKTFWPSTFKKNSKPLNCLVFRKYFPTG